MINGGACILIYVIIWQYILWHIHKYYYTIHISYIIIWQMVALWQVALWTDARRMASCRTLDHCELYCLTRSDLEQACVCVYVCMYVCMYVYIDIKCYNTVPPLSCELYCLTRSDLEQACLCVCVCVCVYRHIEFSVCLSLSLSLSRGLECGGVKACACGDCGWTWARLRK